MSLFADQRRRMDLSGSPSLTGVVGLANENLYASHNHQLRNGPHRPSMSHNLSMNQNRNFRPHPHPHLMDYHKAMAEYDDLPPSYDEVMKNEDNSKLYLNPLANTMLNSHLGSAPDAVRGLNAMSGSDLAIQLDAGDQLDIGHQADNPPQSDGQSDTNHPPHVSDVNHPNYSVQANHNATDGSNSGETTSKAASNNIGNNTSNNTSNHVNNTSQNVVCQPNADACPNWENSVNNNDPNNNHSLAAR